MKLQTKLSIDPLPVSIGYQDNLTSLGSCFADDIGKKLKRIKLDIEVNPAGTLYNPMVILHWLQNSLEGTGLISDDIFSRDGIWLSDKAHGSIYGTSKGQLENKIRDIENLLREQASSKGIFLLTWGSAFAWSRKSTNKMVANCHKQPANLFSRTLLSVEEIAEPWIEFIQNWHERNPDIHLIFTVSPVRHIRDGLIANNLSKSTLLLAVNRLTKSFDRVHYFPAYEILLDELRDYRFYASDLLHPSDEAIQYIFERFLEVVMKEGDLKKAEEIKKLLKDLEHTPLHPESQSYQEFSKKLKLRMKSLEEF